MNTALMLDNGGFPMNDGGYFEGNQATLETLQKALTAGSGVDAGAFTGGRALIPESLDNTLVNVLHSQDEARFFQRLKKTPISSPVHQWDERTEVGADDGGWVAEQGESQEANQTIARKYGTAKYLQTLRKVSLQASVSRMIEEPMVLEQNAGTLWIIRNIEKALFYGNSSYVTEQPDGLVSQIPASNVLDMRGGTADSVAFEDMVNDSMRLIRNNYGKGSLMLMSPKILMDMQKLLRDRIRVAPSAGGANAGVPVDMGQGNLAGYVFRRYPTLFGDLDLVDDIFVTEGGVSAASSLTAVRPDAPTHGYAVSSDAASQFGVSDAGTYYYKVVSVNKYGDSLPSSAASQAVAAGEKNTITITTGTIPGTYAKVYRSVKDGSNTDLRFMGTVALTAGSGTYVDYNQNLPGCSDAFILTLEAVYNAVEWFQFLPMMKFNLFPTNAAVYPFLLLLFGFLALKKPTQHIRIKNIAPSDLGWF